MKIIFLQQEIIKINKIFHIIIRKIPHNKKNHIHLIKLNFKNL